MKLFWYLAYTENQQRQKTADDRLWQTPSGQQ
jgi:hypothetical protein